MKDRLRVGIVGARRGAGHIRPVQIGKQIKSES